MDYGIKISQPGFDVKTATPSQLVFSSKYQTLKVHVQGDGSITDSGGRTITIAHNLGYVPAFLVHSQVDSTYSDLFGGTTDYFISPFGYPTEGWNKQLLAWADSTNLYIKVTDDFGWNFYYTGCLEENYCRTNDYTLGTCQVGRYITSVFDGGLRFPDIDLDKGESFYKADLKFYIWDKDGDEVHMILYGIDEDNTLPFDEGSEGTSRDKTTASDTVNTPADLGEGQTFGFSGDNIKSIISEIIGRNGWANGNALGFIFANNEADEWHYIADNKDGGCGILGNSYSYLKILRSDTLCSYKYTIFKNPIA